MKRPYMHTIIGSSGRDCVLIILFQLYGTRAGLFEGNLSGVGQYEHSQPSYWKFTCELALLTANLVVP